MTRMRHTHFKDIRLSNNCGISFPCCHSTARLLDLDKSRMKMSGNYGDVTCPRCLKMEPKHYPWASFTTKADPS